MRQQRSSLFIWICASFLAQTVLILYFYEVPRSCECGLKNALHTRDIPSKTENKTDSMIETSGKDRRNTVDFSSIMYLEPLVEETFLTIPSTSPRIPHIIHQAYNSERIPVVYGQYVKSIAEMNPNWTYYFWTDESSRKFIAERFPSLLKVWDDNKINKMPIAAAIRYLVLYEFGGFYADLDIESKRPLDNLTTKYACIFPTEPFEQSVFRLHVPYLFSNAIMLCRPKHPFLKQIIDTLHQYQPMLMSIDTVGPSFITSQFIRYNNITADYVYKVKQSNESNSPYFYKGELPEDDEDAVYVPNTQYFINSLSQEWMNERHYKMTCAKSGTKSIVVQRACNELTRRLSQKNRDKYAFTDHHWVFSCNRTQNKLLHTYKSLKESVNKYIVY
ncbi:uncharacterized protein LOC123555295 [Mercenaria mercenaria]|uniref:uncharacterized protein LOC123555295 n=1 Tax=Mercenaria mercenaria TaxID=6596 RepID=UPI00234EAD2A|nr:uncharacterized protein LOC123555295 [Mercenaria mercenaria]